MGKKCILFLLFPFLLQAAFFDWFDTLSPKAERAKELLKGIDPIVEKALVDFQVPGLAIGVVVDGHLVYAKGFGYRDLEQKLPVNADTIFPIGSCTKAFTTFAMGNLVDEGLLAWDQPVIDLLPEFRLWDQYATQNVTIRDLLTHRSGMPRHELVWYNSKMTRSEMLKKIRYLEPSFDIRERYQYNNLMYFIAGYAMEQVTGKSWEEQITTRILKPLGMKKTNFSIDVSQKTDNYACPYIEKNDQIRRMQFRNLSLIGPAGCLNSNISDLALWVQMHLAGGVYKNQSLIGPATLQELFAAQVIVPGAPESKETLLFAYGIGWAVLSYRGHYYVSHDGISDGFTSVLGLIPSENVGVIVLANKNMTSLPRYISFQLLDRILELPAIDWIKEGSDGVRKNKEAQKQAKINEDLLRKKGTSPCHPLQDFVGVYDHPGYGQVTIELVDDHLRAIYNDLTFILGHWHYDVFYISESLQDMIINLEGTKFRFCNDLNGEIGELSVPFEPNTGDITFKRKPEGKLSTLSYLRQFTGTYEIYGYTIEIIVRDNTLFAVIPGQPTYELVPSSENEFSVKTMTGSSVRFVLNALNHVEEILLTHPYGTFSATPKK